MSKYKFVGFQEHIEIPEGFERLKLDIEFSSPLNSKDAFGLISDPENISQWLFTVKSFESKQGGKVVFQSADATFDAVCTSFVLGKEVSFVSDEFGNLKVRVIKNSKASTFIAECAILTDRAEEKTALIEAAFLRLQELAQQ